MGDWISSSGQKISEEALKNAAEASEMTVIEYANMFGFTAAEDSAPTEGKQDGSTETTPPVNQNQTPAGDSSSGDISLESPEQGIAEFAGRVAENVKSGNGNIIPVYIPQEGRVTGVSDPYMGQVAVQTENEDIAYYDATNAPTISTKDDVYGTRNMVDAPTYSTEDDVVRELADNPVQINAKLSNVEEYNPELKTDFVSSYYDPSGLSAIGIEPADFEAWLSKKGFSEDFENDVAAGVYTAKWYDGAIVGEEFTKEEALEIAKQNTLYRFLQDYINETQGLVDKRNAIADYAENKDFYSEAVGYQGVLDTYYDKAKQEQSLEPLYNYNELQAYNQVYFPELNKRNEEIAKQQAAEIKKQKERNSAQSIGHTIDQTVESSLQGFFDAGMDFMYWAEDGILSALGNDSYVDRARLYEQEVDAWDIKNLNYMSAEGKKVQVGDTNYLVSDDGTIYDVDAGMIANSSISQETAEVIFEGAKNSKEYGSDVNVRGGAIQMGAVMGNIAFQVMATRGLGNLRAAASARYMANANGFKNVAQYNKYMNMVNRGGTNMRGITNASTFGLKVPFNPAVAESTIFQSFYGAASGYEQTIMAAKNAGLTNKEAEDLASQAMLEMGILYGVTGPINPRISAMKNLDDFLSRSGVVNKAVKDFLKAGKNPIAFKGSLKSGLVAVAQVSKNFISEGTKEVVQENIQQFGETTIINKRLNEAAGIDFVKDNYSRKEFMETSVLSFVSAGLLGSVNLSNIGFKPTNRQRVMNLYAFAKDMKGSTARLNSMVKSGRITQDQADEIVEQAGAVKNMMGKMPAFLLDADEEFDVVEIATLMSSIDNMQNQKKRMDKSTHGVIDASIAEAEAKVEGLFQAAYKAQARKNAGITKELLKKHTDKSAVIFESDQEMLDAGYTTDDIKADGFMNIDGNIVINLERASKTGAVSVGSHEMLHVILRNEFSQENMTYEEKSKLINEFRKILRKEGMLDALDKRASLPDYDITINADGTVDGNDIDEYLNFFSDAIAKKEITFDESKESFWVKFGKWLANIVKRLKGNPDVKFENGQQVFDFVRDYQSSIQKGKLSLAAQAKAKASIGVKAEQAKMSISDISKQADRAKQVLEKVSSNMEFFDPNSPLIARVLPGMIQAQLAKLSAKGLQFDAEEANSDILLRLYSNNDIGKFDGRGTLYGYINGRIAFRIKDMLKAAGEGKNDIVEDFNQSDIEDLKGAAADVTTTEQIEERQEAERPEYKGLLERAIVSPETLSNIEEKLPRIVGTLKSRIDEKVSKNRTVTPFVNELRLSLGKQIDIDLKKEMGGKKDHQLRKWLTKNKRALLENMTTTYLMTAMPIAVQKKVDGVWTSDWKGKKIDRETTSTDKAGRTSGAEMVRRLPNAAAKIDDKTFLSYILEESGNPIRGKKESWAKATAEELAIEIVNREMQNPDSKVRQALEMNQERLGVELVENYVAQLRLDFERGNVKRSVTAQEANSILNRVRDAGLAKLDKGDGISFDVLLASLPPEIRKDFEDFINKTIIGTGTGQFKTYIGSFANEDWALTDVRAKAKVLTKEQKLTEKLKIANKLVNNLDPLVLKVIGDLSSFGINEASGYTPAQDNAILKLQAKISQAKKGESKLSEIEQYFIKKASQIKYGSKISSRIRDIQGMNISVDEKRELVQETLKEDILEISTANMLAMSHFLDAIYSAADANVDDALGALLILGSMGSTRGSISFLTGIKSIELHSGSQAPYIFTKSGKSTWYGPKDASKLLKNGVITVNVNHPLYAEAKALSEEIGGNISVADLLSGYNEHIFPQSKIFAAAYIALEKNIGKSLKHPELAESNRKAFRDEIGGLLEQFNLYAASAYSAKKFDDNSGFGRVSEAGEFRIALLDESLRESFYDVDSDQQTALRLAEGLRTKFDKKLSISEETVDNAKRIIMPSAKLSVSVPQAIFMVGGPGAGKSSIVKGLKLIDEGYRYVNQDPYLEKYIQEAGLPTDEKTYDKEQRSIRAKLGWKARKAAEADMEQFTNAKESMIVDGTGASYKATTKKMKALEAAGFEIHMIFVNTSKDVAVKRNRARVERSLADFIVTKTWDSVQESAKQYREDYAGRFYEINTDKLSYGQSLPKAFVDNVNQGLDNSKRKYSVSLSEEFNNMIERQKGVASEKEFSRVQAKMMGEKKGKYRIFVPSSAEDFRGLTSYTFAGRGKQGEADQKFFEDNIINPYVRGVAQIEAVKQQIRREYHAVAKANKQYFKMLGKKIGNTDFTYDQALRVYMWTQQGIDIPGMAKDDIAFLINEINQFPGLIKLGNAMQAISRQDTWVEPTEHWMSNTLVSDLNSMTEKVGRRKYLQEFIENSEIIFSPENLNKIEAVYGTRHREAIEDALYSMKNGRNRPTGMNKQMNQWLNWVNNSTGAIMFFNIRSAVLQTLSATNFINWSDNNPVKAAAAFANQPQFWADFAMIFNSDKLKQRRSGLQTDVNTAEIANQAEGAQNKAGAVIAYLLKIGFTPTQIADSFAIAMGGASFYRNRVNTYLKEGLDQEAAEKKAFEDFSKTADEAQQSSDPYLVSQEQRSPLGRLVLAFQNTPMQYTRLMKKAMQDLVNGRGDAKTHISKIIYYGAVQNFIFSALQSALFAMIPGFDDEEDESGLTEKQLEKKREKEQRKEDTRYLRIINSMTDSILKGSGVKGAVLATIKNTVTEYFKQKEKGWTADHAYTLLAALSLSPPIGSKVRKIYSAIQGEKFDKDVLEARGFSIMANGRLNLSPAYSIIGSLVSGTANVPMDRMVDIVNSMVEATDNRNTVWQRIALAMGWKTWDVGAKNEEHDLIIQQAKEKRKEEGKKKAKETREKKKEDEKQYIEKMTKGMSRREKAFWIKNYKESKKNK